ncbi:MAG: hypothetical protein IPM24_07855 [Bryobacterales bacterium]|nr:hypothetical protein [Bryobacterales bacterium]
MIVRLERHTTGLFTGPMCVREPMRMPMRRIAVMDVQERSLGESEQEARGDAEMDCTPHFPHCSLTSASQVT